MGKTHKKDPEVRSAYKKKTSMYNRRAEKDFSKFTKMYDGSLEEENEGFLISTEPLKKRNAFR